MGRERPAHWEWAIWHHVSQGVTQEAGAAAPGWAQVQWGCPEHGNTAWCAHLPVHWVQPLSPVHRQVCGQGTWVGWWSRGIWAHLLLRGLQNYNSLLNNHGQENAGSHQKKKIPHIQGQRSPNKIVQDTKSCLETNPIPAKDTWRAQTKSCAYQDSWRPVGYDYRTSTGLGKQTPGGHKQKFVCNRSQEKGAVFPQDTEPDLPWVSWWYTKVLNFDEFLLIDLFFLRTMILMLYLRNLCLTQGLKNLLCFLPKLLFFLLPLSLWPASS